MAKKFNIDLYENEISRVLNAINEVDSKFHEFIIMECLKRSRRKRYFGRIFSYQEKWEPVLRSRYQQYVVSNTGFVKLNKVTSTNLQPAFEHPYARAGMSAPHRKGAKNEMVHELVYESFVLKSELPKEYRNNGKFEVINHLDGDKYNPALNNLEPTEQGKNMLHAYMTGLRKPRT